MRTVSFLFVSVIVFCCNSLAEKPQKSKTQNPQEAKSEPKQADSAARTLDSAAHASGAPSVDAKTYIIGAEDVLLLRVWNEAQLTGTYIVRPDGKISMSLIGDVQAATLTPEKLGQTVTTALSNFINHPDVSVSVRTGQQQEILHHG